MDADFDVYRESYLAEVDHAVAFARTDATFFAEMKADDLIALSTRHLGPTERLRLLDFGCGTGAIDGLVAPVFRSVVGVDVSRGLLDVAARTNPAVEYRSVDDSTLPGEDNSFDLAFASCVFHHIDPRRRREAAGELARVISPGGLVVVYEHNPLNPLTRIAVERCEFDEGVTLLRAGQTRRLLTEVGLRPIETRFIVFFPWRRSGLRWAERLLARIPLGGQYVVAARKPRSP